MSDEVQGKADSRAGEESGRPPESRELKFSEGRRGMDVINVAPPTGDGFRPNLDAPGEPSPDTSVQAMDTAADATPSDAGQD